MKAAAAFAMKYEMVGETLMISKRCVGPFSVKRLQRSNLFPENSIWPFCSYLMGQWIRKWVDGSQQGHLLADGGRPSLIPGGGGQPGASNNHKRRYWSFQPHKGFWIFE